MSAPLRAPFHTSIKVGWKSGEVGTSHIPHPTSYWGVGCGVEGRAASFKVWNRGEHGGEERPARELTRDGRPEDCNKPEGCGS